VQERTADRTAIYTLAGVIAAATLAFVGTEWAARTSFDAQTVQIGVGILSADPGKSDVAPARKWAVDLVEKHSGLPFSAEDRENLLHHPILSDATQLWLEGRLSCKYFVRNADGSWTDQQTLHKPAASSDTSRESSFEDFKPGSFNQIPAGSEAAKFLDTHCKGWADLLQSR
jgi:hypothetical protein